MRHLNNHNDESLRLSDVMVFVWQLCTALSQTPYFHIRIMTEATVHLKRRTVSIRTHDIATQTTKIFTFLLELCIFKMQPIVLRCSLKSSDVET